jgi:hypothetical protein
MRSRYERLLRWLICFLGIHRDNVLYEPPHVSSTGKYRKGLFCVYCGREGELPSAMAPRYCVICGGKWIASRYVEPYACPDCRHPEWNAEGGA